MIFCKIDSALLNIIKNEAKECIIIDCGAGDGLLGSLLPNVISLDIMITEKPLSRILPFDCTKFKFPNKCLPVFIRPCHSGFPMETIENNIENFETILYVSAPENIEKDLGYLAEEFPLMRIGNWVGEDGEFCYKMTINKPNENMKTFVLVKSFHGALGQVININWHELGEMDEKYKQRRIYNRNGGFFHLHESYEVLETVKAKSWDSELIDKKKTSWYQDLVKDSTDASLKIGWLSPDGTMHYCKYENHISYAHEVLETDVPTLEKSGWIHVRMGEGRKPFYYSEKRITQRQAEKLREIGIEVFEDDILYQ